MKQLEARIPYNDFITRTPVGMDIEQVEKYYTASAKVKGQPHTILKYEEKPEFINNVISQISSLRGIGKEVEGWGVTIYPPAALNEKGKFIEPRLQIEPAPYAVLARYILTTNHEVMNFYIKMGKVENEQMFNLSSCEAFSLPIGIASSVTISFNNVNRDKLVYSHRGGFRPKNISKNPRRRYTIVFDAFMNAESVTKEFLLTSAKKLGLKFSENDIDKFMTMGMLSSKEEEATAPLSSEEMQMLNATIGGTGMSGEGSSGTSGETSVTDSSTSGEGSSGTSGETSECSSTDCGECSGECKISF